MTTAVRSHAASLPPYMTAKVRARAPAGPPETGASMKSMPPTPSSLSTSRAAWGPMVEVSITWVTTEPAASQISAATEVDTAPSGRLRTTTSAFEATSPTLSTNRADAGARAGPAGSKHQTSSPASARLAQSALPMLPSPMKPTLSAGPVMAVQRGSHGPRAWRRRLLGHRSRPRSGTAARRSPHRTRLSGRSTRHGS